MSSSKLAVFLVGGGILGFLAGYGTHDAIAPSSSGGLLSGKDGKLTVGIESGSGSKGAGSGSLSGTKKDGETIALVTSARARAEAAEATVALLEKQLAQAREQLALVARSSGQGEKRGVGESRARLDPEAAKKRLESIGPEVAEALEKKNGQKAMALFKELAALGKDGWPLAAKLGTAMAQGMEEGDGGGLGISGIEYLKGIATADLPGLYADAIESAPAYDLTFRKLAVWGLFLGDKEGSIGVLLKDLTTEQDDSVSQMIAGLLVQNHDPANVPGLLTALDAQKNAQTRQTLVNAISEIAGDAATAALQRIAASDGDPAIQAAARIDLQVREAQVAGFLVIGVNPGSVAQQAGLQEGDILTAYRGAPIPNQNALNKAMAGVQPTDGVLVDSWRQGVVTQVTLKGGQLWQQGANGRFTRPAFK